MNKPSSLQEYLSWAKETIESDFEDPKVERIYGVNLQKAYNILSKHSFFTGLQARLEQWEEEYQRNTESKLFMEQSPPELFLKPYESAVDKSFRVNILWNENFPNEPKHTWVTSRNIYYYFNDLIRCSLVCRFIDGPRFVTDKLLKYAKELKLDRREYSQERDDGYYAYHFYVRFPVQLLDANWEKQATYLEAEIQITTQLQEVLRSLTHSFYKSSRLALEKDSSKWKWDFKSSRFRVGYLSHTLHLLESIILESRDNVTNSASVEEQEVRKDEE